LLVAARQAIEDGDFGGADHCSRARTVRDRMVTLSPVMRDFKT